MGKILEVDDFGVYLRLFGNVFTQRPTVADLPALSMERIDSRQWPIGCVPILIEGFLRDDPQLLANLPLTDQEREDLAELHEMQAETVATPSSERPHPEDIKDERGIS